MSETKPKHIPELKENKETEPKITVNFFFSAHRTAEDFSRLSEALKNADVFIPELAGWSKEEENYLNDLSSGAMLPYPHKESGLAKVYSLIYNLKIPIVLVDVPNEHPLITGLEWVNLIAKKSAADFIRGNFDSALKNIKEELLVAANLMIKKREKIIAAKLKEELSALTTKFPKLKNKKNINVLIALGAAHTSLHAQLKSELDLPKKILGRNTIVFGTYQEILRRLARNPREKITDQMYAQTFIEELICKILAPLTTDTNKLMRVARKLSADASLEEIQSFSKNLGASLTKTGLSEQGLIRQKLEQIGVNLPKNEEEIDGLLNMRKK